MAIQFASEELTEEELDRRVAAVRAAKRRAIEAGKPAHTLTDEEIDRAIEDAEPEEQPVAATIEAKASPPKCDTCGRPKTPRARGWWCGPCWKAARSGVEPTPVVNPRPPKPTYDEPTALERQMVPAPPAVVDQVVPLVTVEPAAAFVGGDFGEMLRETAAMRSLVEVLGPLRPSTRVRVARWLADRFDGGAA